MPQFKRNFSIRGRLGSFTPLIRNIGLLISFFVGGVVKYEYRPYIFISLPLIYLFWLLYLPNTPQFYLKHDDFDVSKLILISNSICFCHIKFSTSNLFPSEKLFKNLNYSVQKAEKALMFYKNCDGKSDREKSLLNAELERLKLIDEQRKNSPKIQLNDFCNRMALKSILISIVIAWLYQMAGCSTFTNYASFIFEKSGSSSGIHISSMILAVAQIAGGLLSTQIGDTFGRKTTLNISLFGSAVGLFTFSAYMYLRHNGYDVSNYLWIPVTCLSFIIFISSAGFVALINTCVIESFPPKVRST